MAHFKNLSFLFPALMLPIPFSTFGAPPNPPEDPRIYNSVKDLPIHKKFFDGWAVGTTVLMDYTFNNPGTTHSGYFITEEKIEKSHFPLQRTETLDFKHTGISGTVYWQWSRRWEQYLSLDYLAAGRDELIFESMGTSGIGYPAGFDYKYRFRLKPLAMTSTSFLYDLYPTPSFNFWIGLGPSIAVLNMRSELTGYQVPHIYKDSSGRNIELPIIPLRQTKIVSLPILSLSASLNILTESKNVVRITFSSGNLAYKNSGISNFSYLNISFVTMIDWMEETRTSVAPQQEQAKHEDRVAP